MILMLFLEIMLSGAFARGSRYTYMFEQKSISYGRVPSRQPLGIARIQIRNLKIQANTCHSYLVAEGLAILAAQLDHWANFLHVRLPCH
jgi:hypothetical protein